MEVDWSVSVGADDGRHGTAKMDRFSSLKTSGGFEDEELDGRHSMRLSSRASLHRFGANEILGIADSGITHRIAYEREVASI